MVCLLSYLRLNRHFERRRFPLLYLLTHDRLQVAQKSLEVTSGDDGEGVEWVRNEPYDNTDGHWGVSPITGVEVPKNKGQYTLKRYHIKSKIPSVGK
jgi:hypothetical protein